MVLPAVGVPVATPETEEAAPEILQGRAAADLGDGNHGVADVNALGHEGYG